MWSNGRPKKDYLAMDYQLQLTYFMASGLLWLSITKVDATGKQLRFGNMSSHHHRVALVGTGILGLSKYIYVDRWRDVYCIRRRKSSQSITDNDISIPKTTVTYPECRSLCSSRRHRSTCKNVHRTRNVMDEYERRKSARQTTVEVWYGMYIDSTDSLEGVLKVLGLSGRPGNDEVMNVHTWMWIIRVLRQFGSVLCGDCFYINKNTSLSKESKPNKIPETISY